MVYEIKGGMMTRCLIVSFLFLIIFGTLYAENEVTLFHGGTHKLDLSFYSTFFMGQTARSRNFGNTISSSLFDTHLISSNPAGMSRARQNLLTFDFAPGFGLDINKMYSGLQDQMNSAVDSAIESNSASDIDRINPSLVTNIGQSGWINQLGIVVHDRRYGTFGFSWHRPLFLEMDYIGNAINFTVRDETEKSEIVTETTLLPLSIELFSGTKIAMHQSDFAYAYDVFDKFTVGATINYSNLTVSNSLDAKIGGFIRKFGGDEDIDVAFDDPNVDYPNSMNSLMNIDFKGNFIGSVFSASYSPSQNWHFDVAFTTSRTRKLNGSLLIVQNKLGALNLSPDDDEDVFDITLLSPDKVAYTNQTVYESNDVRLTMPGKIAFSTSYTAKDHFKFILSYEKMLSDFRIDYTARRTERGEKKNEAGNFVAFHTEKDIKYSLGLAPKHTIKIALGCDHFALSAQVTIADLIADGITDSDGNQIDPAKNIIIPGLGLGSTIRLSSSTTLDIGLVAIPAPFFRSSLSWKF
jgi:hypothetical protein